MTFPAKLVETGLTYVCVCCVDSDIGGPVDPNELVPRRVGEAIGSTVGTLATLVNYPISNIHLTFLLSVEYPVLLFNSNS